MSQSSTAEATKTEKDIVFGHGKTIFFLMTRFQFRAAMTEWSEKYATRAESVLRRLDQYPEFKVVVPADQADGFVDELSARKILGTIAGVIEITLTSIRDHVHPDEDETYYSKLWTLFDDIRSDVKEMLKQ